MILIIAAAGLTVIAISGFMMMFSSIPYRRVFSVSAILYQSQQLLTESGLPFASVKDQRMITP